MNDGVKCENLEENHFSNFSENSTSSRTTGHNYTIVYTTCVPCRVLSGNLNKLESKLVAPGLDV